MVLSIKVEVAGGHRSVLSIKVELVGLLGNAGVLKDGGVVGQANAGVPVTARRVAKRAVLVSR
jgi:hypothetical protein